MLSPVVLLLSVSLSLSLTLTLSLSLSLSLSLGTPLASRTRTHTQGILLTHASIADCAVIGHAPTVADEEKVIAYVVKKDEALTAEQVMAHVAAHVAVYKQVLRMFEGRFMGRSWTFLFCKVNGNIMWSQSRNRASNFCLHVLLRIF